MLNKEKEKILQEIKNKIKLKENELKEYKKNIFGIYLKKKGIL
jgi:hypothetical protein